MPGTSVAPSVQRPRTFVLRALQAGCEMSFLLSVLLLAATLASATFVRGDVLWALRFAMLTIGVPLLVASMGVAAFFSLRAAREADVRAAHRLRERLYFVATLVLTVLVPSALLGARAVLLPRPGGALPVHAVEAGAWLLAAFLLWGSVSDARALAALAEADQPEAAADASERSMSSIR